MSSPRSPLGIICLAPFRSSLPLVCVLTALACPDSALEPERQQVTAREWVASWTVGLGGIHRIDSVAAKQVLASTRRPAMMGIAAPSLTVVTDEMIEIQPFGNWANLLLIPNAMDQSRSSATSSKSVAANGSRANPDMTPRPVVDPSRRIATAGIPDNKNANHRGQLNRAAA